MKNKINKILFVLLILIVSTKKVYGATVRLYYTYYNDVENGNYRIEKNINGNKTKLDLIKVEDGQEHTAYCIDVGANLQSNESISSLGQTLENYLNSSLNNSQVASSVAKKINEYIHFGYGYGNQTSQNYYAATQKLIWDELYNNGYRKDHYAQDVILSYGSTAIDLSNEISNIKKSINNYYKTPSFCSNDSKLEIANGQTANYTDTNGVLSQYKVTCDDGLTCTVDGNVLKVTANQTGKGHKITFTKDGSGTSTTVYKENNNQAVVIDQGSLDPVSCDFGIDSYQNVQTSDTNIIIIVSLGLISVLLAYAIYISKKSQILN